MQDNVDPNPDVFWPFQCKAMMASLLSLEITIANTRTQFKSISLLL